MKLILFALSLVVMSTTCVAQQNNSKKKTNKKDISVQTKAVDTTKTTPKGQEQKSKPDDKKTEKNASVTRVDIAANSVFEQISPDEKSKLFTLNHVPDTLIISFPSPFDNYSVVFNKDSSKQFKLDFSKTTDDKNAVYVDERWLSNGELKMVFQKNDLIGIIGRPSPITGKSLVVGQSNQAWIKIINQKKVDKVEGSMYDSLKTTDPQKVLTPNPDAVAKYQYYCGKLVCSSCNNCNPCPKNHFDCLENAKDLYGIVFQKPDVYYKNLKGNKNSIKYWIIIDNTDGNKSIPTYFKVIKSNANEAKLRIMENISPAVRKLAVFTVIGPADSTYLANDTTIQYYSENESNVAAQINGIGNTNKTGAGGPTSTSADTTTKSTKKSGDHPANSAANFQAAQNILSEDLLAGKLSNLTDIKDVTGSRLFDLQKESIKNLSSIKDSFALKDLINGYAEKLVDIDSLQKLNNSFKSQAEKFRQKFEQASIAAKKLQTEIDAKDKQIKSLGDSLKLVTKKFDSLLNIVNSLPKSVELQEKFLALERDLLVFNGRFGDLTFVKDQYDADLLCLQNKILELMPSASVGTSKDLAQSLINMVKLQVEDKGYYQQFSNLIKSVEALYTSALGKKPSYRPFSRSEKIPNTDELTMKIKTKNSTDYIYNETFKTSSGMKIDFSTGIFINGITSPTYVLGSHHFQYGERKDTFDAAGTLHPVYTGKILDTTNNLIQSNQPKYSYSAGFLAHFYPRTGSFVNVGAVTGLTITNSNASPFVFMAGGSLMFNMGKTRVSLVGGICWGQVKVISSVASPYLWNQSRDPDNKVYQSINDVPRFYTASSDIPTYDTWKHSWFFGVTYNFASVDVGK